MSVNLGTAEGYLDLDITKFKSALVAAQSSASTGFKNMEQAVGASMVSVGKKMTSVGKSMTTWVTAPIVGAGAAIVKTTADFDEGMSKVQALSGATGDELQQLRDKAKEMGAKTKFSATESAEAFQYMALAGWKTGDMLEGIEGIMNLAAASGENLGSVSDIVTDGLTAFGLQAKDSAHFADVLAAAMANSNTDVAGLGEAFKYVGPVAGAFGYSIEDVSIALGTMANAGIKGSSMGTSLRQALVQLTAPTDTAAAYMDKYGISLYDSEGRTKSLMDVMQDLRRSFGDTAQDLNLTEDQMKQLNEAVQNDETAWYDYAKGLEIPATAQEKLTALTEIFGARSMPAMLAVIQASEGDFNKLTESIYGATKVYDEMTGETYNWAEAQAKFGDEIQTNASRFKILSTASEMQEKMMDNLNGQITIIKSSLEGFAISLGELLMPKIREFAQKIQELVDKFNNMSNEQKMAVVKMAGFVAAIGPALMGVGKLVSVVGTLSSAFGALSGVMAGGGIGAALLTLETNLGKLRTGFRMAQAGMAATGAQSSVLGAALGSITAPVAAVIAVVVGLVAAFAHLWNTNEEFRNKITGIWSQIQATFNNFCQGIVDRLNALGFNFKDITEVIGAAWDAFCNLLAPVFETAFQQIQIVLETVLNVITGILDVFIGLFTGNWDQFWNGLKGIVSGVFNGIKNTIENVLNNGILGIIRAFSGNANLTWQDVWNGIKNTAVNMGNNIVNAVRGFINNVVTFFSQLPGKIAGFLSTILSRVASWVSQMANNARSAGQQFLNNVSSFIQQLPGRVGNFLGTVIGTVAKWVIQMANNARQAGQQFLQNVVSFFQQLPGKIQSFISDALSNVVKWASQMVDNARQAGSQFLQNVINFFQQLPGNVASFLSSVISNVASWASTIPQQASEAASSFLSNVSNFISQLPGIVAGFLSQVISTLAGWVSEMGAKGAEAIQSLINAVVSGAAGIPGQMAAIGSNIVQGVWSGIQGAIGWFTSAVNSFFSGIVDGAKSALGIASPSKVFKKEVGENIVKGIKAGITSESKSLQKEIDKLNATILKKSQLLHRQQMRLEEANGKDLAASTIQGYKDRIAGYTKEVQEGQKKVRTLEKKQNELLNKNLIKYAKEYLKTQEDRNKMSLKDEEAYWNTVAKMAKKGSENRKKALQLATKAHTAYQKSLIKEAKEATGIVEEQHKVSLKDAEQYWLDLAKQMDKGSKQQETALKYAAKMRKEYQNDILETAKQTVGYTERETTYSMAQLEGYWRGVAAKLDAGTKNQKQALKIAAQAHKEFVKAVKDVNAEYKSQISEQMASFKQSANEIKSSYKEAVSSLAADLADVSGLFGMFTSSTENSTYSMVAGMASQVNALKEYNGVVAQIRDMNLPKELESQLVALGTDGLADLKLFVSMTDEQLSEYVSLWKTRSELAQEEAKNQIDIQPYVDEMNALIRETDVALAEIHKTYKDSMAELGLTVNAEMPKVGQGVVDAMQFGFDKSKGSFVKDVNSLVSKVKTSLNEVTSMYRQMAEMAAKSSQTSFTAASDVGNAIASGTASGIKSGEKAVESAAADMSKKAIDGAKKTLKIQSPSKVFADEIGAMLPPGMVQGVKKTMPKAADQIEDAVNDGIAGVEVDGIAGDASESFRTILSSVKTFYEQILDWIDSMTDRASQIAQTLVDGMTSVAANGKQLAYATDGGALASNVVRSEPTTVKRYDSNGSQVKSSGNGDTFIFNSPKPIDEIEAAKQMKRAKQDLAEGF